MRNFLDDFRHKPSSAALERAPQKLAQVLPKGELFDAYLAAVADSLALKQGLPVPLWAWAEDRKLRQPWFALPYDGMRALLLLESPGPFRSRNLFVSANALSRA